MWVRVSQKMVCPKLREGVSESSWKEGSGLIGEEVTLSF